MAAARHVSEHGTAVRRLPAAPDLLKAWYGKPAYCCTARQTLTHTPSTDTHLRQVVLHLRRELLRVAPLVHVIQLLEEAGSPLVQQRHHVGGDLLGALRSATLHLWLQRRSDLTLPDL